MIIFEIFTDYYRYFLRGAQATILLSLAVVFVGSILGSLLGIMRLSNNKLFSGFSKLYITVIRGTPLLVQLWIVYFQLDFIKYPDWVVLGMDFERLAPCVIALSLNSAAYVAEIIRAGIQAVDKGQGEAARSIGNMVNYPWLWIVPGVVISLFVLGVNFFGDGLRDALDVSD